MKLISINVGKKLNKPWRDGTITAIQKTAITSTVLVSEMGLDGDEQSDTVHHGGRDKAVLILPAQSYKHFEVEESFGFLGENLTIEGLDESQVCLGDRLQIGNVLLEVTQPRSPCWKLDAQAIDSTGSKRGSFLKAYSESGRVGFYCRVLASGTLTPNQKVIWLTRADESRKRFAKITIQELFLAKQYRRDKKAWKTIELAVEHPSLSSAWREELTKIIEIRDD